MSKQIVFNYEGKDYTLEYNRDAIKYMENRGFSLEKFTDAPITMLDIAFEALFLKNHRNISSAKVQEILKEFNDKRGLISAINDMLGDSYTELLGDPEDKEEGEGKNISWKTV